MAYEDFIPQNIAPSGSRRIGIYDDGGNRVGQIPLGTMMPPIPGKKLYSFGVLSDVHIVYETAQEDLQRALRYLNEQENVVFTCICGDLTGDGTEPQLAQYKAVVDAYSNTPVYAVAGNHEAYASQPALLEQYTGKPLYYSFEHGDDVFIMAGICSATEGKLFADGELQWLDETLERYSRRRCFLFQHIPPAECCGDVLNIYPYTKLGNHAESNVFKSLLSRWPNIVFFHGHTHMKYHLQKYGDAANYDKVFGCHSVHIPSLAVPRDANGDGYATIASDSEGYVVDVYENGIHLRGRNFVTGEFVPVASYWLDTTPKIPQA